MQLDVVIVGYESADHIERAIDDLPSLATVVVIDNASTDCTVDAARGAGARVVANDVNAGFAAAANQGAALGSSELIVFLNPDAAIDAAALGRLVDAFHEHPELAIVSPRIRYDDGSEQRVRWPYPSSGAAWREAFGLQRVKLRRHRSGSDFVIGACFVIRRQAFEQLGGFDTRYWLYGEEADLCRRALDAGWTLSFVEGASAVHVGGASSDAQPELVVEHFERGGERFVADREGRAALVSYRAAKLVGSAIRAVAATSPEQRSLHRERFRRYLRVLRSHPTRVALDSPANAASPHTLVVCSSEPWDEVWRRNQFLVRELLDADPHLRVLFVEPAFDWFHQLRHPEGSGHERGLRSVRLDGRVLTFRPAKYLPRVLGPLADRSLRRQVRRAAAQFGFVAPTLWINDVTYAGLAREVRWPSLYDITDDWLQASLPLRVRRRLATRERALLCDADEVVVCSQDLATTRRQQRPDLRVVPNAVDVEHFVAPVPRPPDLPPAPVAVYVGTLHSDRLDIDLVLQIARQLPALQVALVGPNSLSRSETMRLEQAATVHLLGGRPYPDVPGYLQHADVVVVPHVVSPFTESLDPIKAYECIAVGRTTVATPVAGFRGAADPIRCVPREDFCAEIARVLEERPPTRTGATASWRERAEVFGSVVTSARSSQTRRTPA